MSKRLFPILFLLPLLILGFQQLQMGYASPYTNIDVNTAYNMITSGLYPNLVVLDVRRQDEYDSGHIYGAVWIPVSELEARIDELAGHEDHEIIVYCRSGGRSATASGTLDSHGFAKVYNMLGGILAWQSAGFPVWIATVHNLDTTFNYDTIQAAIDAHQTLDGHTILVNAGTYYENVVVDKSISLVGEDKETTIIDGNGTGTVIFVTAELGTVSVDISDFTIVSGGSYGILLWYSSDNIIKDNVISANGYGIYAYQSSRNTILNNAIIDNHDDGIHIVGSADIINNTIASNGDVGVHIATQSSGNIINNTITNNGFAGFGAGIWLSYSPHSKLGGNSLTGNLYNFGISGDGLLHFMNHDIDTSNTINGKPLYFLINQKNLIVDPFTFPDVGYLGLINSTNVIVRDLSLTENAHGVLFAFTNNSRIEKVNASNNFKGISLEFSWNNTISRNTLSENHLGLSLRDSSSNLIYHNNFINNTNQAYVTAEHQNTWDDGYPSGGNYWSNYTGADLFSGPYQNMTGSDGTGDKPHDIDEYNRDCYPLMKPCGGPRDIGIVNVTTSKTLVVQGHNVSINIKMINYGINNETFNVTAYANELIIQTRTITLTNRNSTTVTLTWNSTGFSKGKYTISAKAHPVPGEIDTTDNTLIDGLVKIILQAHDIAVTDVMPYKTVVGKGYNVSINVTAENWGNYTETFNVTAYYNLGNTTSIPIETKAVTLTSGGSTTVTFRWDTTGVAKGNYTITAVADTVPDETDTTDNALTSGWIIVAMIGDITGGTADPLDFVPDGKVDMKDIATIARFYGLDVPPAPANCDITGLTPGLPDGKIDMRDVATAARHFGETDP